MPFIGNQLSTSFQNVETQTITGDGSTSYTLNNAVADGKDLLVYINNVKQEEGSGKSYTATGTTITFTEAVASTDSCYVVFIGQAVGTVTPKDGSIVSSMLADANLEMPNTLDLNGKELILDADADTSITADTDDQIDIKIAGSDNLRIKANEIENVSGDFTLDVSGDIILDADDGDIQFKNGGTLFGSINSDASSPQAMRIQSHVSNGDIIFKGNDGGATITALTLDMSEAGQATFTGTTVINTFLELKTYDDQANKWVLFTDTNDALSFNYNGAGNAEVIIDTSGSVGIGVGTADTANANMAIGLTGAVTSGNTDGATIGKASLVRLVDDTNWGSTNSTIFLMGGGTGGVVGQISSAIGFARESNTHWGTQLKFYTHPADTSDLDELKERMRIDGSGNVLIGRTSVGSTGNGHSIRGGDSAIFSRDAAGETMSVCRNASDGELIRFKSNNSTVGNITTANGDLNIGTGDTGLQFRDGVNAIRPHNVGSVANRDDAIDLGQASVRFDDIHATNGTIQTSDQNEKQDIANATTKELNVAKKLSTLFKTFRWKSKVVEKGDKARTHTGIIAQEVQTAFKEEGLDASKYGLFIMSTWWEKDKEIYDTKEEAPEDAEEKTRLGVRYPELFSFIFSSIEARLSALEAK